MEASPMSLFEKFIKEAYGSQYVIPVYQRNYTWKKNKQVKQLLADIERILKGETKKHFIGTVVYNIVKTDFMVREREVVDGQQRLITMFLIAYALRNIAKAQGADDIAQAITSSYLENNSSDKYKYRLQPSVSDDDAYSYIAKDIIGDYEGIQNSCMSNCIVLDPFLGSGSTLIACEQTGRICYGIELDEKFMDVIVKRFIEQTGSEDNIFVIRDGVKIPYAEVKPADENILENTQN